MTEPEKPSDGAAALRAEMAAASRLFLASNRNIPIRMITAGVMSRARSSPARMSACISDSESPRKHTSDSPQFGRSQINTRLPGSASATASSRTPG